MFFSITLYVTISASSLVQHYHHYPAAGRYGSQPLSYAVQTNRKVTLCISDNGEGILPDVLDKIFVSFFTTKTSGSGIGLSL